MATATKATKKKTTKPTKTMEETKKRGRPKKAAPAPVPADTALVQYNEQNNYIDISRSAAGLIDKIHGCDSEGNHLIGDTQLVELFKQFTSLENAAFVLRGAAAYEIVVRMESDGREFSTTAGNGVDSVLVDLTRQTGVKKTTLYEDYKIYRHFKDKMIEQLKTDPDQLMPREFYRLSLQTADVSWASPHETLEYFEEQRDTGFHYTSDHARRDVKRINDGLSVDEVKELDAEERMAAVEGRKTRSAPKKVNEPLMSVQISATREMEWYISKIMDEHGSVNAWILRRAKEEFGDVPRSAK